MIVAIIISRSTKRYFEFIDILNFLRQRTSINILVALIVYLFLGLIVNVFWNIRGTASFLQLNIKMNVWKMLINWVINCHSFHFFKQKFSVIEFVFKINHASCIFWRRYSGFYFCGFTSGLCWHKVSNY